MPNILAFPDRGLGFSPERLVEARLARQMSRAELARELSITGQAIGYYETGERRPDMSVLLKLADSLDQPVSFFLHKPSVTVDSNVITTFFRSIGNRSNKVNNSLSVKTGWLCELVEIIATEVKLPAPTLIATSPPPSSYYSLSEIEAIATELRRRWGLGDGPIANAIALCETFGIIVTRMYCVTDEIDAFSCWVRRRPYIVLGGKKSACRSRFDVAHELGHILLHRDIGPEELQDKVTRDRVEYEANLFAGAFMLPRSSMLKEFYSTRITHLKGMKSRWRISMQAIAHRAKEIGIIDEQQYVSFRKQISFHKWLTHEPLDDELPLEQPKWLLNCWKLYGERKKLGEERVEDELGFSFATIMELFGRSDTDSRSRGPDGKVVRLN